MARTSIESATRKTESPWQSVAKKSELKTAAINPCHIQRSHQLFYVCKALEMNHSAVVDKNLAVNSLPAALSQLFQTPLVLLFM